MKSHLSTIVNSAQFNTETHAEQHDVFDISKKYCVQ